MQHWGYETHHAGDRLKALNWLTFHQPSLILMDIHLPGLSGLDMVRYIRADLNWQRIPVIAITALAMPDDRDRCLAAGLQDYISKPFDPEKLAAVIPRYKVSRS